MRALSLYQPWASLVCMGLKKTETRSWQTSYRGLLAIHAARAWTPDQREAMDRFRGLFEGYSFDGLPRGKCVLAVAELVDCYRFGPNERGVDEADFHCGDFAEGRYGWRLKNVRPLRSPLELNGQRGLWVLSQETAEQVLAMSRPLEKSE